MSQKKFDCFLPKKMDHWAPKRPIWVFLKNLTFSGELVTFTNSIPHNVYLKRATVLFYFRVRGWTYSWSSYWSKKWNPMLSLVKRESKGLVIPIFDKFNFIQISYFSLYKLHFSQIYLAIWQLGLIKVYITISGHPN